MQPALVLACCLLAQTPATQTPEPFIPAGELAKPPAMEAHNPNWSADLLLGIPLGVRVQRTLGGDGRAGWLAEGFVGLELILPMAGVGIRRQWAPYCGENNRLLVNPGLGLYYGYLGEWSGGGMGFGFGSPSTGGMAAVDVDLIWQRDCGGGFESQFGLKLGAGAASVGVLPLVSLFGGFRF